MVDGLNASVVVDFGVRRRYAALVILRAKRTKGEIKISFSFSWSTGRKRCDDCIVPCAHENVSTHSRNANPSEDNVATRYRCYKNHN
jgi:hypothetical protein